MAGQDQRIRGRFTTVHISAFVASLAALAGCASNKVGQYHAPAQNTDAQKARLSQATLDPSVTQGPDTLESYQEEAYKIGLPQEHLTEIQVAAAQTQARRAAAQTSQLSARADFNEGFANADAQNVAAMSDNQIAHAGAERLAQVYDAKIEEMDARAAAAEVDARIEYARKDDLLGAAVKEWQSEVDKLQAHANADWTGSQAEHDRMLVERTSVETRATNQIEHMRNVSQRTAERAEAKAKDLRAQALSVSQQTTARVAELRNQLTTVSQSSGANVSELRQRSQSEADSGTAKAAELRARATAIEEQDVDETFRLSLTSAESAFAASKAEAERLFQQASALEQQLQGEFTSKFTQANQDASIDQADFEEAMKSIDSFIESGKSEVANVRVNADTVERQARAAFIAAEAQARAGAVHETGRQKQELAEEQAARISAEAEAEAARIQSEYVQTIARQRKHNKVTLPDSAKNTDPTAKPSDVAPEFSDVQDKTQNLDPKHVAAFKIGLAQASKLREQADAQERDLFATAEERRISFTAWMEHRDAAHDQAIADVNTYKIQTQTQIDTFRNQAQSMLDQATAMLGSAKMQAEAGRQESLAQMTNLRAEADATEKKSTASHTQFSAQAECAERTGQSELRSLEVIVDSTQRQGDAQVARLNAEADSLQTSQAAVISQMNQEIASAQQIMTSELAKLDQSAESYLQIAKAVYDERVSEVAMLQSVNEATRSELAAKNTAEQLTSLADAGYLRDTNLANTLIAQASVQRVIANADADLGLANADDTLTRAALLAQQQMTGAAANEQFQIAGAEDHATRATFDARVASTISDRDRAYAGQYLAGMQSNLRQQQAVASAAAYAEISSKALALLNQRTEAFDKAAQRNWHSALAQPSPLPKPIDASTLNTQAEAVFNLPPIANAADSDESAADKPNN